LLLEAMPELRLDRTTMDWVVFAPSRARRPDEFRQAPRPAVEPSDAASCPFCPGNESRTPAEVYAIRDAKGTVPSDWKVRVIPNKFPALRIEESPVRVSDGSLFRRMGGCGAHEVIIESPDHHTTLLEQPVEHVELVLRAFRARYLDLMRDSRFQAIVLFKNQGEKAGTSLTHPHCQLVATPVVPRKLRLTYQVATDYFDAEGTCLYCVLRDEELAARDRMVVENDQFVAFVPYAAQMPFETWILPRAHQASFGRVEVASLRSLADILKKTLRALDCALDPWDYNLVVQSCARGDEDESYFLWHIEIFPRLTTPAGFELGSGMFINPVRPEEAAEFLRASLKDAGSRS
jgi:UDPglucose--hexose-1-phosphate uridylyltransferase